MPFIDTDHGRAYYRHWAAAEPAPPSSSCTASASTPALYHRYGFALNAAGIDLWAVDQFGHGLSPGDARRLRLDRGQLGARRQPDRAGRAAATRHSAGRAGPFVRCGGHAVPAAGPPGPLSRRGRLRCAAGPDPRAARCRQRHSTSNRPGCPPIRSTSTRWRTTRWPSSTPTARRWPVNSTGPGTASAPICPTLTVPTLAVHGVNDPIAPVGRGARPTPSRSSRCELMEFAGARHDILNEAEHREVAAAIIEFIEAHDP